MQLGGCCAPSSSHPLDLPGAEISFHSVGLSQHKIQVCVGVVLREGLAVIPMEVRTGLGCGLWSLEIPAWLGSCQMGPLLMIKDKRMESFPSIFKMPSIYPGGSCSCMLGGIWVARLQQEPPTLWQTGAFPGVQA